MSNRACRRIQTRSQIMNCPQARLLIDAYADGELDPAGVLEMEQHFRECPACVQAFRNVQNLKKSLKQEALLFNAPVELRQRLKSELSPRLEPGRPFWIWKWFA